MVDVKLEWIGLLCNVDSSFLSVEFPHGFEVKYLPNMDTFDFFSQLDVNIDQEDFLMRYGRQMRCINPDDLGIYYLYRKVIFDLDADEKGLVSPSLVSEADRLYEEVIRNQIRLLRLVTDGDVRIPISFRHIRNERQQNNVLKQRSLLTRSSFWHISSELYHLNEENLEKINEIINLKFPFEHDYIQLAFENYEDSYESQHSILSFLSLIIALEILFNPGQHELRYRISRNCAILLGEDKETSDIIFKQVRGYYDVRSDIVHKGDSSSFNVECLPELRDLVRRSILKMVQLGDPKSDVLVKLNKLGFGDIENYDLKFNY